MTLVNLDGVSKRYVDQQVLDDVTLGIDAGQRVGVIGRNGSGKSTLLRIIAAVEEPDSGRVVHGTGLRVAYVPQEPDLPLEERIGDVLGAVGRPAEALLDRLGIRDLTVRVGELSGGQRKRVALARGLAADSDLLVVDEPTNHLDVDAIAELEQHLKGRSGTLVLVTHDRYLLDRLATRIVEVEGGALGSGYGSYSDYLQARATREELAVASERRRRNRARIELEWLRRGPRARGSKAKARLDRAHRLLDSAPHAGPAEVDLALPSRRLGTKVVELHGAGKRYGDRWVLRDIDWRIPQDARVGVVGPNGAGKTTLLALIAGRLAPDAGTVVHGATVQVGWYAQEHEPLPATQRVLDAVDDVAREAVLPDARSVSAGSLLERFGFPAARQWTQIAELSGGERRRLALLRTLAGLPNVLLLDEPTNDLDLDTLGLLEESLDSWRGALVVASHDRYFLDRVCDDVVAVEPDGTLRHYPGGWSSWHDEQVARRRAQAASTAAPRRQRQAQAPRKLSYREQRELEALERQVDRLEQRKVELSAAFSSTAGDHERAASTGSELAAVLDALEVAEQRWLELAEIAEEAGARSRARS